MQRLLLKNEVCVQPSGELLPTNRSTLSCGASCVGVETEAPSERQQWGKRGGGGFAARPFFSPLSQPTKVGLLDAPLTAEHLPPLPPGELGGQQGRGKGFGSPSCC